ncbi:nucleoside-diphosphate sugar epimerase/dehydratase [Pelolinea submarina]|uniref:Glycosyltransferase RgtA/B/C/D-like domain-containing protein n=1 Tax=Pelolinea submarina TaxID=913107 RepID=A0A347ZUL9_9CHLR|nr:hypothetical protein [Pelolinea submarina]REG10413.1 hypothetical protein DFR64_0271 [Pelolinea submarina]BBB49000.1 hypothetical protein Pelsub_P2231 [Pelolinea submarina]
MKKKHLLIFLLFLVLNIIPHLYVALNPPQSLLNWYLTDDAFYYFKVAQNITEGYGITFDTLAPTNGFHPLWMLVCIPVFALARFDLYLPLRVLIIVLAVLNAGSGYFLYRLFADQSAKWAGWIAAIFWMFLPSIHSITTKLGVESGLNAFVLIFFIYRISLLVSKNQTEKTRPKDLLGISLAAMLVLFTRLDNIFVIIMVGLWLVFGKNSIRWISQWDFALILFSVVGSYYARIQGTDNIFNFLPFFYMLMAFSLVLKPLSLYFFGMYELHGKISLKRYILKTIAALTLASLLMGAIFFMLYDVLKLFRGFSRAVIIMDWAISVVLIGIYRVWLYRNKHEEYGAAENNFKDNWRKWLENAAAYFLPLLITLAGYMLANLSYAGSAMPVSGQIKRWWGQLPNTVYGRPIKTLSAMIPSIFSPSTDSGPFWMLIRPMNELARWLKKIMGVSSNSTGSTFLVVMVWLILLGVVLAVFSRRKRVFRRLTERYALLPLLVGCLFHVITYKATGYMHAKYWYWLDEMLLIVLFMAIVVEFFLDELVEQRKLHWIPTALAVVPICALLINFGSVILREFPLGREAPVLYDYEADFSFLEQNTQPGDVIGMTGGGATAYFMTDRIFVNLDGLINSPAYFESIKNDKANDYLNSIGMKYIYGEKQVLLDSDPYRWFFTDHLQYIGSSSMFNLYRYCSEVCP